MLLRHSCLPFLPYDLYHLLPSKLHCLIAFLQLVPRVLLHIHCACPSSLFPRLEMVHSSLTSSCIRLTKPV
ncbi:hypothetical protein GQ43DRAFT_56946 [Delitschia confertaspora ATCC 74209]|uniref:Uncharacterized protein n=1 Tax=Delitschia confertaspora ATCC 74209 TaxID=1513339 RepID=A0A9P4JJZ5_9PLEO|nr:hypothetical protein GQ43DRAFT_56946 [Delitschia confertaspora ATCC 74209]